MVTSPRVWSRLAGRWQGCRRSGRASVGRRRGRRAFARCRRSDRAGPCSSSPRRQRTRRAGAPLLPTLRSPRTLGSPLAAIMGGNLRHFIIRISQHLLAGGAQRGWKFDICPRRSAVVGVGESDVTALGGGADPDPARAGLVDRHRRRRAVGNGHRPDRPVAPVDDAGRNRLPEPVFHGIGFGEGNSTTTCSAESSVAGSSTHVSGPCRPVTESISHAGGADGGSGDNDAEDATKNRSSSAERTRSSAIPNRP